jgi:hypothetical protein
LKASGCQQFLRNCRVTVGNAHALKLMGSDKSNLLALT